jgi:hypothetical protein
MLLEAIAAVILLGMMLIPLVNVFVGVIVGAGLVGTPGAVAGVLLALVVTVAEKLIGDRRGWFDVRCEILDTATGATRQGAGARSNPKRHVTRRRPLAPQRQHRRRPSIPPSGEYAVS